MNTDAIIFAVQFMSIIVAAVLVLFAGIALLAWLSPDNPKMERADNFVFLRTAAERLPYGYAISVEAGATGYWLVYVRSRDGKEKFYHTSFDSMCDTIDKALQDVRDSQQQKTYDPIAMGA